MLAFVYATALHPTKSRKNQSGDVQYTLPCSCSASTGASLSTGDHSDLPTRVPHCGLNVTKFVTAKTTAENNAADRCTHRACLWLQALMRQDAAKAACSRRVAGKAALSPESCSSSSTQKAAKEGRSLCTALQQAPSLLCAALRQPNTTQF